MGRTKTSASRRVVSREVMLLEKESWASRKRMRGRCISGVVPLGVCITRFKTRYLLIKMLLLTAG
jgi:hypothetical protein